MIQIRAITYNMPKNIKENHINVVKESIDLWNSCNFFIRTNRMSLTPISNDEDFEKFEKINDFCNMCNIRWFNVPINPWQSNDKHKLFRFGYDLLKKFDKAFINVNCISNGQINFDILDESTNLIKNVSEISNNGKDNFRLGISSNIGYNCPFFPFSMSQGEFSFSIALELTQEINSIIAENDGLDLELLRDRIIDVITPQVEAIKDFAHNIEEKINIKFAGFDFSLAPIIDDRGSVVSILRYLGVNEFGETGTMFATAYLTNILKHFAKVFPSVGFSGVMYSLLEDLELCKINNEKGIRLEDLIKLSTMCGCGIDMVPVTQDTTTEQLRNAIMEIGAISTRLSKPLGIRFLPIPRTSNNRVEYTHFDEDADFIANTRILTLSNNLVLKNKESNFYFLD